MKLLAPLRGVTIRAFRHVFARAIAEAGFTEAVAPFVSAVAGVDPAKDRELKPDVAFPLKVVPQFIGKDPAALRHCLRRVKEMGYGTADLNAGCPFPMVRNKGRGSGLLRNPDLFRRMLEAGCEEMGEGRFSVKVRLGVDSPDEFLSLVPAVDAFPLRFVTVHARTARQMYSGECDKAALARIAAEMKTPLVTNGDLPADAPEGMIGRGFIRSLASREDIGELLAEYAGYSLEELHGERPVVGRLKELIAYFKDDPSWRRRWNIVKLSGTLQELLSAASHT